MIKVITYGTYDLLHYGHIRLLERAKALGDYLIVGVTSDDYDKTRGKINNQQSLMERIAAVKDTGLADEIIVEEYEGQKIDDIRRYNVDIFTVGSDWDGKFDYLNEFCKVIYLPRTEGISSSELRTQKRKIRISAAGNRILCDKFIRELKYVNGAEYAEFNGSYDNIDAIYISTHPNNHYENIKEALNAGVHVICESPLALKEKDCEELFALARDKKLVLTEAIKTAYGTAYYRLLAVAKSGKIGNIISVDSVCTSLEGGATDSNIDLRKIQNSMCAWGPTALLPVFQLLGTHYKDVRITTSLLDKDIPFDRFTKIDFLYENAVASARIGKGAKSEGELIITGTKGYIYVPAPWWKTDYFEVRFENPGNNQRYFYQLEGEGIRYEIVEFVKAADKGTKNYYIDEEITKKICSIAELFYNRNFTEFGSH